MTFQLMELAIPLASGSADDVWQDAGSTCRKGGSTCVARGPAIPLDARQAEFEMVRQQIREIVTVS